MMTVISEAAHLQKLDFGMRLVTFREIYLIFLESDFSLTFSQVELCFIWSCSLSIISVTDE